MDQIGGGWKEVEREVQLRQGNALVQKESGRLNICAGKFRLTCEGDADLDGQPGDGGKQMKWRV